MCFNLNVVCQSLWVAINLITVDRFAVLFNCTAADKAEDSMMTIA